MCKRFVPHTSRACSTPHDDIYLEGSVDVRIRRDMLAVNMLLPFPHVWPGGLSQ